MAASDQTYRSQRILDIVFAVSCVLMLGSIVWMFVQDYNRDFKKVQRTFREVDDALLARSMLEKMPPAEKVTSASEAAEQARNKVAELKAKNNAELSPLIAAKAKQEAKFQAIKADYDSAVSLWNIQIDLSEEGANEFDKKEARAQADTLLNRVNKLNEDMNQAQRDLEATNKELRAKLQDQRLAEDALAKAEADLKLVTGDFDRFGKLTAQKTWNVSDAFRNLPVVDAFAPPFKVDQYTLADYPIDYNFKYVTRFDRCTTCHLGLERSAFSKEALGKLTPENVPEGLQEKLDKARELFTARVARGEDLGFKPGNLPTKVGTVKLTQAQINQFCVHPRLDLFVDANSPHRAEKFGCTSCHAGQGSSTTFDLAAHAPNDPATRERWENEYHWEGSHFWDFPMLPSRFIESTCLKCHHQVTDLIRFGNKQEAPKLIRGFNLVRENGCFGCHEISGLKNGKAIGPDMRLELSPPLESYSPAEQARLRADVDNPPGTMRKVGPSLYRLAEKTNATWTRQWLDGPRGFRPSTRMPHFYNLSNNSENDLPPEQKAFPAAEIESVAYYLFSESEGYLAGKDKERRDPDIRIALLEEAKQKGTISDRETKELAELTQKRADYKKPIPIADQIKTWEGEVVKLPAGTDAKDQVARGARLFKEKGCLACHTHEGSQAAAPNSPGVTSDADFGPDLTRLAAKIAPETKGANAKRTWLVQWILDPRVHFPRTRMPYTYLTVGEADDVAAWLLAQPATGWQPKDLAKATPETLAELARVYLLKAPGMTRQDANEILAREGTTWKGYADVKYLAADADERHLAGPITEDKLRWYIGRKAIGRLGCFGCHEIPGYAASKPIGTQLNDWGKKDPERLAFEDIDSFVKDHYSIVASLKPGNTEGAEAKPGKPLYEEFYDIALKDRQREGFLHQKLNEPRSYDYNRLRTWDDRLRMPQFRFARGKVKALPGETPEQAESRAEAEAREAVMTFILGLVAEPVPKQYLHTPDADRLAAAKGRQVLDKFNCVGCHQVQPGIYELERTPQTLSDLEDLSYQKNPKKFAAEYRDLFKAENEWTGKPSPFPNSLLVHAVPDQASATALRLTEALRVIKKSDEVRNKEDKDELPPGPYDVPASSYIPLPEKGAVKSADVYGGAFAELLSPYLKAMNAATYGEYKTQRAALPPPLLREGEKTQPGWLYRFLLHPVPIRPAAVLRMPRFNMSDEDAMTLVNYFSGTDRIRNPGEGLNYPYFGVAQREPGFWAEHSAEYQEQLKKSSGALEKREKELEPIWTKLREGQKDVTKDSQSGNWRARDLYATDAYRMLANYNTPCLGCHQVGSIPAKNPKHEQGPPLDLTWERLRPDWTLRWIANPDRLLSYPTPMPQNFPNNQVDAKGLSANYPEFIGTPTQQIKAVRNLLMDFPRIVNMPENRDYKPPAEKKN